MKPFQIVNAKMCIASVFFCEDLEKKFQAHDFCLKSEITSSFFFEG